MGTDATGMGMDDDVSAELPLPRKSELLDYLRRACTATDEAVAKVDEAQMAELCVDLYGRERNVATVLLSHVTHLSRHLGMMEALRGIHGVRAAPTA